MIHLAPTPDVATADLVIGLVIRKPLPVVKACLDHLKAQELPPKVRVRYHVIFDTDE